MSDPSMKVCPRCLSDYADRSVLSNIDSETEICWTCGLEESLIEWYEVKHRPSDIPGEVMERQTKFSNMLFQKNEKKK
jgi:hypothetical protein